MGFLGDWGGLYQAQTLAGALEMDLADYLAARREGRSIAALAEERGVDVDTLVQAVTDERQPLLDAAVEAGLMTQADADWLMTESETAFRSQIENPTAAGACAGRLGGFYGSALLDAVADALGMDRQELLTELQSGRTLGERLDEQGIDADTEVIEPVLAAVEANLQAMVDAGTITQPQMDAILTQTRLRLTQLLDVSGADLGYGYPGMGMGSWQSWGYGMMPGPG